MRKLLTAIVLALFVSGGIIGCEASATIDDNDHHDTTYKKTTVKESDGDRTVKTEIHRD